MPLTPFHWSVVIFGFVAFSFFYIPALVISSVVMDVEPFYFMFISPSADGSLHGFFHTYLGVTLLALAVALLLIKFRKQVDSFAAVFKVEQRSISNEKIFASSLLAAWSHVFLDSFMHWDLKPFWPLTNANPFLNTVPLLELHAALGLVLIIVFVMWLVHVLRN